MELWSVSVTAQVGQLTPFQSVADVVHCWCHHRSAPRRLCWARAGEVAAKLTGAEGVVRQTGFIESSTDPWQVAP